MNFLKKLFQNRIISSDKNVKEEDAINPDNLSTDELFVRNFISKGGKFLYCSNHDELKQNLSQILEENNWNNVICFNEKLNNILTEINSAKTTKNVNSLPFFSNCESLVSEDGSIMFSSKQLHEKKLNNLPDNFIVFAKTSQLVNTIREGVMGVRMRAKKNSPTIVCSIKDYLPNKTETDFMRYGNTNSKTLYLLLLEDL